MGKDAWVPGDPAWAMAAAQTSQDQQQQNEDLLTPHLWILQVWCPGFCTIADLMTGHSTSATRQQLVCKDKALIRIMRTNYHSELMTHQPPPAEKAMANHSSTLAWKIPWTEEPGRLQSMESHRGGHDWSDLAAAAAAAASPWTPWWV